MGLLAPAYSSADGYIGETYFTIAFTAALDAGHPPRVGDFYVEVNGTWAILASVTVDSVAMTVTVTLDSYTLQVGDIVDFTYLDPTAGDDVNAIQGLTGVDAAYFTDSIVVATSRPACFLRGTLILTARGEVAVETLRAGDLVATRFGGLRPVRWIGTQAFEGRLAGPGHQPIRFARGSLGAGVPSCDLLVSPGHAVLAGDVLAHAGALVNGTTIARVPQRGVIEYFHLDLGAHDCVLANGAWAETYFEDHNRDSFHNAAEFHARFPGHEPARQETCLPIVTAQHPEIAALRAALAPAELRAAA